MKLSLLRPIVSHELRLLARNTIMWFRFVLFYLVFTAAMMRDVLNAEWNRFSVTLVGLMILAAVGIASALSAESFAQEKERGTMEALLLVPTSTRDLVRTKMFYIVAAALCGVLFCLATGTGLAIILDGATSVTYAVNRSTLTTAALACPPAVVISSSLGILISCRVTTVQHAAAAATLSSIVGMLAVLLLAYILSVAGTIVTIVVSALAWLCALIVYRVASTNVWPQVMLRTRGR